MMNEVFPQQVEAPKAGFAICAANSRQKTYLQSAPISSITSKIGGHGEQSSTVDRVGEQGGQPRGTLRLLIFKTRTQRARP